MTELSFLIDLLINPRDPEKLKKDLADRIKTVEENLTRANHTTGYIATSSTTGYVTTSPTSGYVATTNAQAPSTLAAMARHERLPPPAAVPPAPAPLPVEQIAQTAATAQAMQSRQDAIAASLAGKVDKVNGRPRKF